jgi:signal peptidase I
MSRQASRIPRHETKPRPSAAAQPTPRKSHSGRESVESFVVVFIGFLVWSIEAEGFVIPTGSMAPTLMGRHKVVNCPQCDYVYTVNADREIESSGPATGSLPRVRGGTCVNCRFEASIGEDPSFAGDRIYVMKTGLSLPFTSPSNQIQLNRWDVGVFKLPENPEIRYIKRTVGLPNEVIRIQGGDLWRRPLDDPSIGFERLRRPLEHQQATQMMVYDDTHRARALDDDPRWRRWAPAGPGDWTETAPGTFVPLDQVSPGTFENRGTGHGADGFRELRYRNIVPEPEQWRAINEGAALPNPPRASLITDFYSYNTDITAVDGRNHFRPWFQPNWVGDLTVSFRLKVSSAAGILRVSLIKAGIAGICEINLDTRKATLRHGDDLLGTPADVAITHGGDHEITFANVDGRLTLKIDKTYPFGDGRSYDDRPNPSSPTAEDLEPVRIGTISHDIAVSGLVLKRDIYYTLQPTEPDEMLLIDVRDLGSSTFFDFLSDPSQFAKLEHQGARDYPISPGCYMMLGDNSPWSRDGRAWGRNDQIRGDKPGHGWDDSGRASWEVPNKLVVGKAFCVYWPNAIPMWPRLRLGADLVLPLRPSVEKIRWIR